MTQNEYKESLKVLHSIITEPNEFKRYTLLQLWVSQLFSSTIIDPIRVHENRLKDTSNLTSTLEVQSLYDVLRDMKTSLTIKNEELKKVLEKMKDNMNIIKVVNKALGLEQEDMVNDYKSQVFKLEALINTNNKYIEDIQNLSESKIDKIINDN